MPQVHEPGVEAEVDWGEAVVEIAGQRRNVYGSAPERQRGAPSAITQKTGNPTAGGATSGVRAGPSASGRNEEVSVS